ncbi:MAG: sugar nucleotide-binding protein, partial [Dehalococcoidales bacterium]|nr:sugar nucleotide-binding protein [Dehalococcoidales bacterium]
MRVLIIGANGMLGHKLYQVLGPDFDVHGTIRGDISSISGYDFFDTARITASVNVTDTPKVAAVIESIKPDAVINAAGVVKSRETEAGVFENRRVNAMFPHELYGICSPRQIRIIHLSTDCVFSGKAGNYTENDPSDAEDTYGKTKFMGEISGEGALTIRTSMIGRELGNRRGLLEWFLANRGGTVTGYTTAIFSGFPTLHLARIIGDVLKNHAGLS